MTSRDKQVLFFAALVAIAAAVFGAFFSSRVKLEPPKTEQATP
jgi:hypothetical protein